MGDTAAAGAMTIARDRAHNGSVDPSGRAKRTTTETARFDVLVVGATNVRRSLAVERLLRAGLGQAGVAVTSAGTAAETGAPGDEHLVELLAAEGVDARGHGARQLDAEAVQSADLVLCVTRDERAEVVSRVPTALQRTFTVRELARLARSVEPWDLPDADVVQRLSALVRLAAQRRGFLLTDAPEEDDLRPADRRGRQPYATVVDEARSAVDSVTRAVALSPGPDAPGPAPEELSRASEELGGTAEESGAAPEEPGVAPEEPEEVTLEPAQRYSRARRIGLVLVAAVLGLAAFVAVGALVMLDRLDDRVERFPDPFTGLSDRPEPVMPGAGEGSAERPVTILVLGSTDDLGTGPEAWEAAAAATDVVTLVRVPADRQSAQVVAMPPDLTVEVPGLGPSTLRRSFALAGPAGAVRAVEQVTGVRIDHVALAGSATFARVTEALGGVDLDVPTDLVVDGRVAVPSGERRLDGETALQWVQGTGANSGRTERAVGWLRAILDRLNDTDLQTDPIGVLRLLDEVSGAVAVDESLDRGAMIGLFTSLRRLRPGDVRLVPAPTLPGVGVDGTPVDVPDTEPFDALMEALRTDTLSAHLASTAPGG